MERNQTKTSGLDALAVRPAASGSVSDPLVDPQMPIASTAEPHLTIDAEGIVSNSDGTCVSKPLCVTCVLIDLLYRFWISDEYGPYIYRFAANGSLIQTIQPPAAILPLDSSGALDFTSETDPTTGRAGNQGLFFIVLCLRIIMANSMFSCRL